MKIIIKDFYQKRGKGSYLEESISKEKWGIFGVNRNPYPKYVGWDAGSIRAPASSIL